VELHVQNYSLHYQPSPELNSSHYLQNSFQATQLLTHAQHRLSAAKHYTTLTESKNTSIKHQYVGILACQIQQCRAESCINSYLIISLQRTGKLVWWWLWRTSVGGKKMPALN